MFNIIEHMSLRELQSLINAPELGADELMRCALGVKTAEVEAYCALSGLGKTTVQEVADRLDKSRPTTQRLLQSLVEKGLATREEELIGLGGYKFVYSAVPPERLKASIQGYARQVVQQDGGGAGGSPHEDRGDGVPPPV